MQHKRHILHKEPGLCVSERLNSTGVALIVEADPLNGSDRATHARYALQDLRQSKQEAPIKGATITGRGGRVAIEGNGLIKRFAHLLDDSEAATGNRTSMAPLAASILSSVTAREKHTRTTTIQAYALRRAAAQLRREQTVEHQQIIPGFEQFVTATKQPYAASQPEHLIAHTHQSAAVPTVQTISSGHYATNH